MSTATTTYNFSLPAVGGDADGWGTLLNSNWQALDSILNGDEGSSTINIDGYTVDGMTLTGVVSLSISGGITEQTQALATTGTVDIDPADGTIATISMTGNVTITAGNMVDGQFVTLKISSVGANTVTWPSISWMYGVAPTLDQINDNWVNIWKVGTSLYGSYLGYSS